MRTLTIGLDGCSWNVLEPLLESGELPQLQALRERGASGILESTLPFFTGPAWASYATGASPAAHGVYDFMMLRAGGRLSVARQQDLRRVTYFEQLTREGKRSVMINLPIDLYGSDGAVIVNSWLTDASERRLLPADRSAHYASLLEGYRTFPVDPRDVDELLAIEAARFSLAQELHRREDWDHFFVLFSSTDWLGHGYTGSFIRGDDAARRAFLRLYKQLDGYIGWLVEHSGDALVAVISDHGQCGETAVVRVNNVLRRLGFATEAAPTGADSPFFVDRRPKAPTVSVPSLLSRYRTHRLVRPAAQLAKRGVRKAFGVQLTSAGSRVDLGQSRAFTPTDSSFAVYTRDLDDATVDRIRDALLELRLPDGRAAFDGAWSVEELYGRASGPEGPRLIFSPALGVRPSARLKEPAIQDRPRIERGCHQRDGIVVVAGQRVVSGTDLGRTSICDVAPTLLWAMGSAVPSDGDGRVLFEAFESDFAAAQPLLEVETTRDSEAAAAEPDSEEVTRRLEALGYI
jgi:predicted AlkP superfamily phosphohydrolase/phosphomutase